MKQKESEREREHFMLGGKKYNVDSIYFHTEAMLEGSTKLPGTSWQKKINENTALRTELYLLMPINGAEMEAVQDF